MIPSGHDEEGFTLVETLIAFAILASALIIAFESFGLAARNLAAVRSREAEFALARNEIGKLALLPTLKGELIEGTNANATWQLQVTPLNVVESQGASVRRPFLVVFFMIDKARRQRPILETIILARAVAP